MKKMWLFVFGFVVALVLAGCSSPTPMASNAMPLEALIATTEPTPEIVVPEFQEINADGLYKLYGEHFLTESLGYSQKDQGEIFLINNIKYIIKDDYLNIQIIDDRDLYMFNANANPQISISAKGMMILFRTGITPGPDYYGCFVANIVKPGSGSPYNRREYYAQATDNFVSIDKMTNRDGNFYVTQICNSGTLINSDSGEVTLIPGTRSVEYLRGGTPERYEENWDRPNTFPVSGYLYMDSYWGAEMDTIFVTGSQLDLGIYSKLYKLLQDNKDKLPLQFADSNRDQLAYNYGFSIDVCDFFRSFQKIIPGMTLEDINKACPGTSNFEQLAGISLYTTPNYWLGAVNIDPSSNGNLSYNDQWKVGVGNVLLDGYTSQTLKLGTTVLDPYTSITSTGQYCKNALNEDGKVVIIVSTLPDSSDSLVECLRKGDYLYLIPASTLYFQHEFKDEMPKAIVFKQTE